MVHGRIFVILTIVMMPKLGYSTVTFEHIKDRRIVQFELTDIIVDLAKQRKLELIDTWKKLSPNSFNDLNFSYAYLDAAHRMLRINQTNQAIQLYIKAYQVLDNEYSTKVEAAYQASFLLYAQKKRTEALFYINRSIDQLYKLKGIHSLAKDIFYLKRRIVWRYMSRLDALPDNAISTIEFDGDDVWIGMWSGAVARFSRSLSQLDIFNPRNSKLPSYYVRDILVEKDKVWVATHCGLAYYNKSNSTWNNIDSVSNYKLKSIFKDENYYYIATLFRGVFRSVDGENWENIINNNSVLDMIKIEDSLYLATPERGVLLYQDNRVQEFLPEVSAKTIIADPNPNFLWIGTYGAGLLKINRNNGKIVDSFTKDKLKSDYVESLLLMGDQLWIGTLESGVVIYNLNDKKFQYLNLQDGLPGLDITTITKENNHIWFGTLAGGIGIYLYQ